METTAVIPRTNPILAIFDPNNVPTAIPVSPHCTEKMAIANPGNDVIMESIRKPMANCPIPVS